MYPCVGACVSHLSDFLWAASDFLQQSYLVFRAAKRSQFPPRPVNRVTLPISIPHIVMIQLRGGVLVESALRYHVLSSSHLKQLYGEDY